MARLRHPRRLLVIWAGIMAIVAGGCVGSAAGSRGWSPPASFPAACIDSAAPTTGSASCTLLVSPRKGKLDGINPQTGDRRWRFPDHWAIEDNEADSLKGIYGEPAVSGDTIFIADYNGFIYAFKPSEASQDEGNRKAPGIFNLRGAVVGGLALDDANGTLDESDTLYVTTDEGLLYALNALDVANRTTEDRNVRGRAGFQEAFDVGERIWTPPVLSGDRIYFGTTSGKLYAVNKSTGEIAWEPFQADGALVSTPVVADNTVLVGGFDGTLYAIDAASGRQKWAFEATDWIWSAPAVDTSAGRVYIADFKGKVYAISLADGSPIWARPFDVHASVRAGPTLAAGNLVVVNEDGDLYGISTQSGEQAWGPVRVGTSVHSDLVATSDGSTVYVAPTRCTSDETAGSLYYYKVNTSTRERQSTGSVC